MQSDCKDLTPIASQRTFAYLPQPHLPQGLSESPFEYIKTQEILKLHSATTPAEYSCRVMSHAETDIDPVSLMDAKVLVRPRKISHRLYPPNIKHDQ